MPPAPLKLVEPAPISVRYGENASDVEAMHRFMLVVAKPVFEVTGCPPDAQKSLLEIIRVTRDEVSIMLMRGNTLIGTMGLIRPKWWFGNEAFLTDRWHFVLPSVDGTPEAKLLIEEAKAIAKAAGLKFFHQGKIRPARNGVHLMMPRVYDDAESAVG